MAQGKTSVPIIRPDMLLAVGCMWAFSSSLLFFPMTGVRK